MSKISACKKEDGFVTILILMLAAALLIIIAAAMKSMYSAHEQNKKDKHEIEMRVQRLNESTP